MPKGILIPIVVLRGAFRLLLFKRNQKEDAAKGNFIQQQQPTTISVGRS